MLMALAAACSAGVAIASAESPPTSAAHQAGAADESVVTQAKAKRTFDEPDTVFLLKGKRLVILHARDAAGENVELRVGTATGLQPMPRGTIVTSGVIVARGDTPVTLTLTTDAKPERLTLEPGEVLTLESWGMPTWEPALRVMSSPTGQAGCSCTCSSGSNSTSIFFPCTTGTGGPCACSADWNSQPCEVTSSNPPIIGTTSGCVNLIKKDKTLPVVDQGSDAVSNGKK